MSELEEMLPMDDPVEVDVLAAQTALLADRTRRSEHAAAAILALCAEYRVHLQPQVTIMDGSLSSRVLIVARD